MARPTADRPDRPRASSAAAPWVRTRLRAAPGAALALAAVVLVTAFLAALLPRAMDAYEDSALRRTLAAVPLDRRSISLAETMTPAEAASYEESRLESPLTPGSQDTVESGFRQAVHPPLRLLSDAAQSAHGMRSANPPAAADRYLTRISPELAPHADFLAQQGVADHARLSSGTWPKAFAEGSSRAEAVVSDRTARVMGLHTGSTVHVGDASGAPLTVRITGVAVPRGPDDPFWRAEPSLVTPTKIVVPPPRDDIGDTKYYWQFGLLVDRASAPLLLALPNGAALYWHHSLDTSGTTARDVPGALSELASLDSGPALVGLQNATKNPDLEVRQQVDTVLGDYEDERSATQPVVLIAAVGVGAAAGIVLLMTAGLAAGRRRAELALLRSRGASLRELAGRLLGETAAAAVPAAAVGTALALAAVRTERWLPSLLLGAAVAAVAALALPLQAVLAHRRPLGAALEREDLATVRPSRRRTVLELTLLVLVAGAVSALRRRGVGDGSDVFVAAAPVLLAVAGALVLMRLYPLPLRLLARPASRLSGAVTHLGLARAGRSPAAGQLPLLAVLAALTVASVGGSVLASVSTGQDRAAMTTVGADAQVDVGGTLPGGLAAHVRARVPGVRDTVGVRVEPGMRSVGSSLTYDLLVVDPAAYARLVRHTGVGAPLPASALADPGRGAVPALVSPAVARTLGPRTFTVPAQAGDTPVRVAAVRNATPATPNEDFVVVSTAGLARLHPLFAHTSFLAPTALFVTGPQLDDRRLTAVARADAGDATVTLRSRVRARFGTPLQSGARRVYLSAVLAGAGYSALALLLTLLQAAPQRSAVLARLRIMGMPRRQSRALVLLEMMPQALLTAVGGVLVSLAAVALMGPDVDLESLAFGADPDGRPPGAGPVLRADWLSLTVPPAGLLLLACAVLMAQVWWTGRRRESAALRVGDRL